MKIAASPVLVLLLIFFSAALVPPRLSGQTAPVPPNEGFATVTMMIGGSCLGCHEWAGSYRGITDPARMVPTFPAKSLLFMRVARDEMPPSGVKLDRDAKLILRAWIAAGAPPTNVPVGRKDGDTPPYPAASNDPQGPIPEPCPCGLD
jgi:hypothetical protein